MRTLSSEIDENAMLALLLDWSYQFELINRTRDSGQLPSYPPEYSSPIDYAEPLHIQEGCSIPFSKSDCNGTDETWVRNTSVKLSPEAIPYNSSISVGNRTYRLSAPLLTIKPDFVPLDFENDVVNLVYDGVSRLKCYNGNSYPADAFNSSNIACASDTGFAWGFSGFLLYFGVMLQFIWSVSLYAVWIDTGRRGVLHKHERRSYGSLRGVAGLSNVIKEELGDELGAYNDDKIGKALSGLQIGWVVEKGKEEDVHHIRLSSRRRANEKIVITEGKLYG